MQKLFALLLLASAVIADLTGSVTTTTSNSGTLSLTSNNGLADVALTTAFSASGALQAIGVTTSVPSTVTISIGLDSSSSFSSSVVAGGSGNAAFATLLAGLTSNLALSVKLTASPPCTITLSIVAPKISLNTAASIDIALLASANDINAGANTKVYGAVAFTYSGGTYTYTVPITDSQLYMVAIDTSTSTSTSSSAATSASTNSNGNAVNINGLNGANVFNYNAKFYPVSLNSAFNLKVGQQYAYGNNIYVTPISSAAAGSAAGSLNITSAGQFAANSNTQSKPPTTTNGGYINSYYQITGDSNANNVLMWNAAAAGSSFVTSNGTSTSTAVAALSNSAVTNSASWYKSNTEAGASAAASSWTAVNSYRAVTASGRVSVWANVNSYSQWTVASSSQNGSGTATKASVAFALLAVLFAML